MLTKDQWLVVALALSSGTGGSMLHSAFATGTPSNISSLESRVEKIESSHAEKLDKLLEQVHQMRTDTEVMKSQVVDMRDYLQQRFGWTARK